MAARTSIARVGRSLSALPPSYARQAVGRCAVSRRYFQQQSARPFSASTQLKEKRYTEDHEWIELAADGSIYTLGISSYAADALGDVTYVELPEIDLTVSAHDAVGAVESVKSASEILTPVAGTVVEANGVLEETPGLLNKDPEGEGWIAKIRVEGEAVKGEVEGLMDGEGYKKYTKDLTDK